MLTKKEAKDEYNKITRQIATAINDGKNKHIFSDVSTGKTTAIIETIKRYDNKYFIVFALTSVVMDIYRRELHCCKNYKLIDIRTSQKKYALMGLVNYTVFFDDVDMMLSSGRLTHDDLEDITLIANAGRASVITTSRN